MLLTTIVSSGRFEAIGFSVLGARIATFVAAERLGWFGLWEMTVFVAVLLLGLGYVWRKGLLKWA